MLLLLLATPLVWWLSHQVALARPVSALVTLPLVLPPTVLGFYLLVAIPGHGPLERAHPGLGWGVLSFSFTGLLIGSIVYSLPFAVQPIPARLRGHGPPPHGRWPATLRAAPLEAFWRVAAAGPTRPADRGRPELRARWASSAWC